MVGLKQKKEDFEEGNRFLPFSKIMNQEVRLNSLLTDFEKSLKY
jgi:hypothetical protein